MVIHEDVLHSISELFMLPDEEFREWFTGKSLGEVLSLKILCDSMYSDARKAKDGILALLPTMRRREAEQAKATLSKLYSIMQNLENKFYIMKALEDERKIL